jgi:hypothetical protein
MTAPSEENCMKAPSPRWRSCAFLSLNPHLNAASRPSPRAARTCLHRLRRSSGGRNRSLVVADIRGVRTHYSMLKTVRRFGEEKLRALDGAAEGHGRSADNQHLTESLAWLDQALADKGEVPAELRVGAPTSQLELLLFCGYNCWSGPYAPRCKVVINAVPGCSRLPPGRAPCTPRPKTSACRRRHLPARDRHAARQVRRAGVFRCQCRGRTNEPGTGGVVCAARRRNE